MEEKKIESIDEYIAQLPPAVQEILIKLRTTIKEAAPEAQEKISWGMPTFTLHGNLVHFAANKSHTGFYPGAEAMEVFSDRLAAYKTSKGAVQFPYAKSLPYELVSEIVRFRVDRSKQEAEEKRKKTSD